MDKDNMSIMFPDLQELMDEIRERMDGEAKGEIVYEWNEERLAEVREAHRLMCELCPHSQMEARRYDDAFGISVIAAGIIITDMAKFLAAICHASVIEIIPKVDGTLYFDLSFFYVATPYRKK